jgi:hypothetical protein
LAIILKKKIYILVLLPAFALLSCGQNSFEKELNGKWYALENDGLTRFFFYPDSLILTELGSQNIKWKANKSIVEFDYNLRFVDSSGNKLKKYKMEYVLSKSKDTLLYKIKDSTEERSFNLIRAENYLNYLCKKTKIDFELPNDNLVEHIELDERYGFKIFIGTKNKVIETKTEFGNGLDSIKTDLQKFRHKINPQGQYEESKMYHESHFRIFADKSISDEKLKSNIHKLTESKIKKVFRIYKSEEYENLVYLRGERIKTIANNAYN